MEINYMDLLLEFYLATAAWVNNLATCSSLTDFRKGFRRLDERDPKTGATYFNYPPSKLLSLVPEFIIENIIDFMLFLRYFEVKPKMMDIKGDLQPLLSMVIMFMGQPARMRNPHLRAKMAELLEALLPTIQLNIPV